jgi:hypothetical protein
MHRKHCSCCCNNYYSYDCGYVRSLPLVLLLMLLLLLLLIPPPLPLLSPSLPALFLVVVLLQLLPLSGGGTFSISEAISWMRSLNLMWTSSYCLSERPRIFSGTYQQMETTCTAESQSTARHGTVLECTTVPINICSTLTE